MPVNEQAGFRKTRFADHSVIPRHRDYLRVSMVAAPRQTDFKSQDRNAVVFVVDDDKAVRDSLERLIRSVGLKVELFPSTDEFLARGHWPRPGCLVLDVRLPGRSGLELQADLSRANSSMPIIFISAYSDVPMSVRAMKAGAVEFITKPVRPQDLLDAIENAIARDRAGYEEATAVAALRAKFATLSAREREVLSEVTSGRMNKEIAAELGITEATVKLHRANVMRKLEARSVVDLVRMVDRLAAPR